MTLRFDIPGEPAPKGSRTTHRTASGKTINREASKRTKPWMTTASQAVWVQAQRQGKRHPLLGPLEVRAVFYCQQPGKPKYPYPSATGDVDKFARALLDALVQGQVIVDDRHVTDLQVCKRFTTDEPRTVVEVGPACVDLDPTVAVVRVLEPA